MENKPRNPWIAGLLAFVTIGLGHIYSGEVKKGFSLYLGQGVILAVVIPLLVLKPDVVGFAFAMIAVLTYFGFSMIDAIQAAKRKTLFYSPKKINKWYVYLLFWLVAGFVIQPVVTSLIRNQVIKAYKIPSGAMTPTLLPGDWILVSRAVYKSKSPQRGDVVVFKYPKDNSIEYVKRLVGIEGDVIEIRDKELFVNNVEQEKSSIVHTDARAFPSAESPRDNFGPVTVPPDSFFVLGDNRDNSFDSRFWGFVSRREIRGKVTSIYWSWDKEAGHVRWERIGDIVE